MIDHVLGRPSTQFRKIQVFTVVLFWSLYLFKGNNHGPPGLRALSSKLSKRLTAWQTMVITLLWLYISRNFAKIMGFESPEPLANLYSRSYFRATWITTALDAGFWTAMKIKPNWLKDIASIVFTLYYLIAAEQADDKVRRVRATLTVEHLRVSWNKPTTPYLALLSSTIRPRFMRNPPREIRIPRPRGSSYREPVNAWLYFDGSLAELRAQRQLVLDVPGGGFVAMNPRTADDRLLAWAGKTGVPVLSVDYKKAPEYPYPYALNECFDVYQSIVISRGRCAGLNGKSRPHIIVSGESAGGNLATGMTIMILQSGRTETRRWQGETPLPPPDGLVLVYPSLDMNIGSWMTEEQMSLIQDRGMRKTNENVLRRKSEDYSRLTPSSSHSDKTSFPGLDLEPRKPEAAPPTKDEPLPPQLADIQPYQIKTRIAVSSMISYFGDRILTPEMMRAMIILYVGPHNRPDFKTDFLLSPILAPDAILASFPKTYFLTGERDPLVDDTVIFAGRIRQAKLLRFRERQELGLEKSQVFFNEKEHVEVNLVPAISHGFLNFPGLFPEGWRHINKCAKWIRELLDQATERELKAASTTIGDGMMGSLGQDLYLSGLHEAENPSYERRRSSTAESSVDEDRPLEMSVGKLSPLKAQKPSSSSYISKQAASRSIDGPHPAGINTDQPNLPPQSSFSSTQKPGLRRSSLSDSAKPFSFPLTLPKLKTNNTAAARATDASNRGIESTTSMTENGSTITRLPSEEDLIGRRMNGLAGGLMGLGEGARTP
ncbi:Alpha/Beta hydrolase protein [Talaromyces proteolyticus]|uniref:Alpha/Beta hydrolase protein n=1 Tax=Talaromyces proteolyticus TaxID=1131652 RepID=A0AAD4L6U8_9EURO|nr:Alpha/Beta hydrolase protein [Talaromyces proteolyticus]KAH8705665.1 Alpha/Beta hydrolase protein [Talaromyces proteolyticus]